MRVERRGMTLIELMLALAIAGPLLTTAVLFLDVVADHNIKVRGDASAAAYRANGSALLRRFLYDVESTTDSTQRFAGEPTMATFTTLCPTPRGGVRRCHASLEIAQDGDSTTISLQLQGGSVLVVRRVSSPAVFRYAGDASPTLRWLDHWDAVSSPAALGIASPRDTMTFAIGVGRR